MRIGKWMLLLSVLGCAFIGWQNHSALPVAAYQSDRITRITLQVVSTDYTQAELDRTSAIIAQRLERLGYEDVSVRMVRQANDVFIVVKVMDVADQEVLVQAVQSVGLLEFVDFSGIGVIIEDGTCIVTSEQIRIGLAVDPASIEQAMFESGEGSCPDGTFPIGRDGTSQGEPFYTVMTGNGIREAVAQVNPITDTWLVNFTLTDESSAIFEEFTDTHIGQRLAIVLDGVVISAPTIQAPIVGTGVIVGDFTQDDAEVLAIQLQLGRLPLRLALVAVETV